MGSRSRFSMAVLAAVCGFVWLALASCGGGTDEAEIDDAAAADPSMLTVRSKYRFHCGACHGKDGRGRTNLFPPLRGSSWANGPAAVPIHVVLHGLDGPITVEGERYLNLMPPLGHRLKDDEIARILTYVRSSWGNSARAVTAAEVAAVRAATAGRKDPMTEAELAALAGEVSEADSSAASPSP
jgi:mono/diheme cytochrome c family protein